MDRFEPNIFSSFTSGQICAARQHDVVNTMKINSYDSWIIVVRASLTFGKADLVIKFRIVDGEFPGAYTDD